ncbi:hypothetical protein [uncultured Flavobacterium sp.]|uniref:hypothetical protein n=1 Tax=uncultured Flavobacterium sp. TaxID=165435 RepID=UPI0030ECA4A9|tara:strand:- start:139433 stop:139930 length:498 start_codon:yes stop_codon:yes gene_type:complete
MKNLFSFLFLLFSFISFSQIQHCGFDFTSYIVVDVHENGKRENLDIIKISLIDKEGKEVINVNNSLSWKDGNKPMFFTKNYLISKEGEKERWFFPYAKDNYLLSVTNTFPAENYSIKVEDLSEKFKTQIIELQSYNLYILCSSENEKQARKFGPRSNSPIDVVME